MTEKMQTTSERLLRIQAVLEIIPVGKSTWWEGVKSGRFPKGIKIGRRTTAWRYSEIEGLMQRLSVCNEAPTTAEPTVGSKS